MKKILHFLVQIPRVRHIFTYLQHFEIFVSTTCIHDSRATSFRHKFSRF